MINKEAIAKTKYVRVSQRKMIGVCNLVRGKNVDLARAVLLRTNKKGAKLIVKTLNSAIANAKNKNMDAKKLYIEKISSDMGPSFKRAIFWSRGITRPIRKRTSHLTIILQEKSGEKTQKIEVKTPDTKGDKDIIKEETIVKQESGKVAKEKKAAKPKVSVKKLEN